MDNVCAVLCSSFSYAIMELCFARCDARTMSECRLGFHTLDVEMAIDDLKEIYELLRGKNGI